MWNRLLRAGALLVASAFFAINAGASQTPSSAGAASESPRPTGAQSASEGSHATASWRVTQLKVVTPAKVGAYDSDGVAEYISAAADKQFLVVDGVFGNSKTKEAVIAFSDVALGDGSGRKWDVIGVGLFDDEQGYVAFALPRVSARSWTRMQSVGDNGYGFFKGTDKALPAGSVAVTIQKDPTRLCWLFEVPTGNYDKLDLHFGGQILPLPKATPWAKE